MLILPLRLLSTFTRLLDRSLTRFPAFCPRFGVSREFAGRVTFEVLRSVVTARFEGRVPVAGLEEGLETSREGAFW